MTDLSRGLAAMLMLGAVACGGAAAESDAPPHAPSGDVVLGPDSPKWAFLTIDSARTAHERVVAVLPAQTALDEDHTVRVFSPVLGRVRALVAAPGTMVTEGAALARIASGDLAQATSDRVRADAAQRQTAAALARAESLYAHKVIAQRDVEQARSDAEQARAEAARAQQRVAMLGSGTSVTDDFLLRSPIAGSVIDRTANPGMEVRPDATTPLFTIAAMDTLWLVAQAPQRDGPWLTVGRHVAFATDAAPGRVFDAQIAFVSAQIDPVSHTVLVRAKIPNRDAALRAQAVGMARLFAPDDGHGVVIPTGALVTRGGETVVFVEESRGHFTRRAVTVADDDGHVAAIRDGLRAGERVVSRGGLLLAAEAERLP